MATKKITEVDSTSSIQTNDSFYVEQGGSLKRATSNAFNNKVNSLISSGIAGKVDKVDGKSLSSEDYTTAEKTKLGNIEAEANKYVHPSTHAATIIAEDTTHRFVTDTEKSTWNAKAETTEASTTSAGLMSKDDKSKLDGIESGANNYVLSSTDIVNKLGYTPLNPDLKGAKNGLAELDSNGKVPSSQLPSYVDDVIEGYLYNSKFYKESTHTTEITGETGKIYVDLSTNKTYRWSGSAFTVISETISLGETSSTAYRGDRGKTAYDHSQATHARTDATKVESSTTNGNIKINGAETKVYTHPTGTAKSSGLYKVAVDSTGHISGATAVTKSDITSLGIPAQDTTYTAGDNITIINNKINSVSLQAELEESSTHSGYLELVREDQDSSLVDSVTQLSNETTELKEDLVKLEDNLGIFKYTTEEKVGYMDSTGYIGGNGYHCLVTNRISCSVGDIFKYKGVGKWSTASWIIRNGDTIVSTGQWNNKTVYKEITIASGDSIVFSSFEADGTDIVLDVKRTNPSDKITQIDKNTTDIEVLKSSSIYINESKKLLARNGYSGYVNSSGAIVEQNSWRNTGWLDAVGVSDVKYTGYCKYDSTCAVAFKDADGNVTRSLIGDSAGVQYSDESITVPSNADKMCFIWFDFSAKPSYVTYKIKTSYDVTECARQYSAKQWVCFGDSLTEFNNATTKHYFDYISDDMGLYVTNMGVGGTGYMRGYNNNEAFYQRINNVPTYADVVTLFGSGNDLSLFSQIGNVTDSTTDTICGCVNKTLDNFFLRCPTTPIGIIAPTPWMNYPTTTANNNMEQYVEKLREIAEYRGVPFLDLYHCSNLRPENAENRSACFYSGSLDGYGDGVHPNELGHKIISSKIREFLRTLI